MTQKSPPAELSESDVYLEILNLHFLSTPVFEFPKRQFHTAEQTRAGMTICLPQDSFQEEMKFHVFVGVIYVCRHKRTCIMCHGPSKRT